MPSAVRTQPLARSLGPFAVAMRTAWRQTRISSDKVAVEDIKVADLNDDGRIDIVAAARQTKNLVIFFNETPQ